MPDLCQYVMQKESMKNFQECLTKYLDLFGVTDWIVSSSYSDSDVGVYGQVCYERHSVNFVVGKMQDQPMTVIGVEKLAYRTALELMFSSIWQILELPMEQISRNKLLQSEIQGIINRLDWAYLGEGYK